MKEAQFYRKLKNGVVQCVLCPHNCVIKSGARGMCHVRENRGGKLFSLVYGNPCAVAVDPIEKKPLYHFLPKTKTLSIGTVGCNFSCLNCQNAWMSQSSPEDVQPKHLAPGEVVKLALSTKCKSVAYTYNEPTVFYEYVFDIALLAKEGGLKNVFVTNGFINPEPLKKLLRVMDAFAVDLKGLDDSFYKKICGGRVKPVLDTLKAVKRKHLEIVVLLIPGYNDSSVKVRNLCLWIKENLGAEVPVHFSRYFPCYKLKAKSTPIETVMGAEKIASDVGLKNVHVGNV
ncbi:MAG: AmmeMemoRadiSam system radical SAM enzyme [archaeon]